MPYKAPMPRGTIRQCAKCPAQYEHFGQLMRLCRPCMNEYNRARMRKRAKDPVWVERRKKANRDRCHRNKLYVAELLKRSRCKQCREADHRTLRFYDNEGHLTPLHCEIHRRGSLKRLLTFITDNCQVLCFNCRAKMPNLQNNRLVA